MFIFNQFLYAPKKSWHQPSKNSTTTTSTTTSASSTTTTSAEHHHLHEPKSRILRFVRRFRTFEPKVFLHKHVIGCYWFIVGSGLFYANYRQWNRMKKLYPDYDEVKKNNGSNYGSMKEQELVDVQAFNAKAQNMRSDLRGRLSPNL